MPKVLKKLTLNKEVVTRVSDNQMSRLLGGYGDTPTLGDTCGNTCDVTYNTCTCVTGCSNCPETIGFCPNTD